jgi:hypothetical protein
MTSNKPKHQIQNPQLLVTEPRRILVLGLMPCSVMNVWALLSACFLLLARPAYSSALKLEAGRSCKASVNLHQITRRHISEYSILQIKKCPLLKENSICELTDSWHWRLITVAMLSKVWNIFARSNTGILGLYPTCLSAFIMCFAVLCK